jgi:glycosyltransferase involved in cell wall biosynthesis
MGASATPRVLIVHNRYRQPGGEDVVAEAQARLLRERGHEVRVFEKDNREIDGYGIVRKVGLFFKTADNTGAALEIARVAHDFRPEVAFVHNTLPLLSPAIYAPLGKLGVKVVQFLHNYRLVCAAGTLYRDGAPCTLCVDGDLSHAVKYRCWTGSKFASLAYTRMIQRHRRLRTWHTKVDLFVALNSHMRDLLASKGVVPEDKIVVQPNFLYVDDGDAAQPETQPFVFAARLVPEKGVATLLKAHAVAPEIPLTIIGEGPLGRDPVQPPFAGYLPHEETLRQIRGARALVFPSEWPEGCPSTIIEAMALGKPVIASRVPGAAELVEDGVAGLLFEPGDAQALAACMRRLHEDAELARRLGQAGRARYEQRHSPDAGYARMVEVYRRVGIS